jgi:hypothetical protein
MRNYFAIAFTFVYLTLAVGVAKTTHYCMGREKNSSLFSFTTEKCVCSIMAKEPMSCCKDQHDIVQIEDDHSSSQVVSSPDPQFNLIGDLNTPQEDIIPSYALTSYAADENDLPPPKVPIYQSNCSLVFYDSLS